jgi:hypothetical protein
MSAAESEPSRSRPGIVLILRILGGVGILAGVAYLAVTFVGLVTGYAGGESNSSGFGGIAIGLGSIMSGVFFLALAFITDKIDSIDHHLVPKNRDYEIEIRRLLAEKPSGRPEAKTN